MWLLWWSELIRQTQFKLKPRLHGQHVYVAGVNMLPSNMLRGRATCCRQQTTCIPLYPVTDGQQTDNNFVDGNKQHVAGNMLPRCKRSLKVHVYHRRQHAIQHDRPPEGMCLERQEGWLSPTDSFCNQPKAHFGLSWVRPWDNRGKCYMDGKRIQCWSNALQHVPIYLQPFTSYRLARYWSEIITFSYPPCI